MKKGGPLLHLGIKNNDYEKQIEIESKKEIENCRADCDKAISQLEDYYKKNGESLAEDIFNNIIKE